MTIRLIGFSWLAGFCLAGAIANFSQGDIWWGIACAVGVPSWFFLALSGE